MWGDGFQGYVQSARLSETRSAYIWRVITNEESPIRDVRDLFFVFARFSAALEVIRGRC